MGISHRLGVGERTKEIVLPISECGLSVVQGVGKIQIGEDEYDFTVGDLAFIPVRRRFVIENTGDEPMVVLGLISPPDVSILRTTGLWASDEP
jgi:mannose-6-phosphate isomerase-like protein (cupin superfamily)